MLREQAKKVRCGRARRPCRAWRVTLGHTPASAAASSPLLLLSRPGPEGHLPRGGRGRARGARRRRVRRGEHRQSQRCAHETLLPRFCRAAGSAPAPSLALSCFLPPAPPPLLRTNRTSLVPPLVLSGHAASPRRGSGAGQGHGHPLSRLALRPRGPFLGPAPLGRHARTRACRAATGQSGQARPDLTLVRAAPRGPPDARMHPSAPAQTCAQTCPGRSGSDGPNGPHAAPQGSKTRWTPTRSTRSRRPRRARSALRLRPRRRRSRRPSPRASPRPRLRPPPLRRPREWRRLRRASEGQVGAQLVEAVDRRRQDRVGAMQAQRSAMLEHTPSSG